MSRLVQLVMWIRCAVPLPCEVQDAVLMPPETCMPLAPSCAFQRHSAEHAHDVASQKELHAGQEEQCTHSSIRTSATSTATRTLCLANCSTRQITRVILDLLEAEVIIYTFPGGKEMSSHDTHQTPSGLLAFVRVQR